MLLAQVSITEGHGHRLVPEDLLNLFEAGSPHYQMRSKVMPEVMKTEVLYSSSSNSTGESPVDPFDEVPLVVKDKLRRQPLFLPNPFQKTV